MNEEMNTNVETMETPVEVTETTEVIETQPSLAKTMVKNGLVLGGTAIIGSVVLKVGDALITKAVDGIKTGAKKISDKFKARKAEKETVVEFEM